MASTAITTQTLEPDTFARKVIEDGLTLVEDLSDGYVYAAKAGRKDDVLYKARTKKIAYLYQARRVTTQDNVAGGALIVRISIPEGMVAKPIQYYAYGPATNTTLLVYITDEDGAVINKWNTIGAGVSRSCSGPCSSTTNTTTDNCASGADQLIGPGQYLVIGAAASAQTETLTVGVTLLLSKNIEPLWDTTLSGGTPNMAASTISTANTLQEVVNL